MVVVSFQVFLLLILSSGIIRGQQEPEVVEVFEEGDAIPSPNEVSGRTFGNFDALAYKENLLHKKISFLFSIIPRPNNWNNYPPPYPGFGGLGGFPGQGGIVPGFPPGFPSQHIPPTGPFRPPYGGGLPIPGPGGFYPGGPGYNPYYPPVPGVGGGLYPGVFPVVAENSNSQPAAGGGGANNKPLQSAPSIAATTAAPAAPAPSSGEGDSGDSAPAEGEDGKRRKTIKMMPKSFKLN